MFKIHTTYRNSEFHAKPAIIRRINIQVALQHNKLQYVRWDFFVIR